MKNELTKKMGYSIPRKAYFKILEGDLSLDSDVNDLIDTLKNLKKKYKDYDFLEIVTDREGYRILYGYIKGEYSE